MNILFLGYCIIGIITTLLGYLISLIEYDFVGYGHRNKILLFKDILLSIIAGILWPIVYICFGLLLIID